jgi:protein involved in polysaccharide export with SLBB domain
MMIVRLLLIWLMALLMQASVSQAQNLTPYQIQQLSLSKASLSQQNTSVTLSALEPLRPGDVISVIFPGEISFNKNISIDRKGEIELPEIGIVKITELPLREASDMVREKLKRAYKDTSRVNLVLKERKLLVTVLGFVRKPGTFELPPEANIQTIITEAGGLSRGAQLDRLQLRRGNELITFDYKRYLDSGDTKILPELRPLDTVFVPSSPLTGNVETEFDARMLVQSTEGSEDRSTIKIFGEVNHPTVFTYKEGVDFLDVLMRAGGVTRYATTEQIRIIGKNGPVNFNLTRFLETGDLKTLPHVEKGMTIFVPKQIETVRNSSTTVYVMGEVQKPGSYEIEGNNTLITVLAHAGGPTRYSDRTKMRILRRDGGITDFDFIAFSETKGKVLPKINPGDAIFVPEKADQIAPSWLSLPPEKVVHIMGAIHKPGRYEWSDVMSLFDLMATAGGPVARADTSRIQIIKKIGTKTKTVMFDFDKLAAKGGDLSSIPVLVPGDTVFVPELPHEPNDTKATWAKQAPRDAIYVMGMVGNPGRYGYVSDLNFLDVLSAANGPNVNADLHNIRISHRKEKGSRVTIVNLVRYLETGDERLIPKIKSGDVIFVPNKTDNLFSDMRGNTVQVLGAVNKPGKVIFTPHMTLLDVLSEAGGPNSQSWQEKIVVVNILENDGRARLFDLIDFAKTGDIRKMPIIRPGDTIYVPDLNSSEWRQAVQYAQGFLPFVTILGLFNKK